MGAVLPLELAQDLPDNWTPLEVVSVVKCLNEEGQPSLCIRTSGGLSAWDIIGMMTVGLDTIRDDMVQSMNNHHQEE